MNTEKREAEDLTRFDFGKRVTIYHEDTVVAGVLEGIAIEAKMIESTSMSDTAPSYTPGQTIVKLLLSGWTSPELSLSHTFHVEKR